MTSTAMQLKLLSSSSSMRVPSSERKRANFVNSWSDGGSVEGCAENEKVGGEGIFFLVREDCGLYELRMSCSWGIDGWK